MKPELAAHEGLYDAEIETGLPLRFAWCMLFTVADREGRFVWRPRTLKAQVLPHDDVDFSRVLDAWMTRGFIRKYRVNDEWFGWIPSFTKHQVINNRESPSDIPPIEEADEEFQCVAVESTRGARVDDASGTREVHAQAEGKEGREGKDASTTRRARVIGQPKEFHEMVVSAYHELVPTLPTVRDWSDRRRKKLDERVAERVKAGKRADQIEYWRGVFEKVQASDFLCGRKSDWRCPGIEWLLDKENFLKVIEGSYDNSPNRLNGSDHAR